MTNRRLMLVHAHPDDESSQSPATMARYVSEGAQVTLVTCTLGECGEILVPEWQHLTPHELGQHRIQEVQAALDVLGVKDHVWLGGLGRYHDSGMARDENGDVIPAPEMPDNAFWKADLLEASEDLVELIRDRRPQVMVTYDPKGNYGHPDHIKAHRVAMYAAQLAASQWRLDLGQPWSVQRMLWIGHNTDAWMRSVEVAREQGINLFTNVDLTEPQHFGPPIESIGCVIPTEPWLQQCADALAAHRSQVNPEDDFWRFFAITRSIDGGGEAHQLAWGTPFPEGDVSTDLFDGLDV